MPHQSLPMASGGELQRLSLGTVSGYSVKAQCNGKPSYLEPNSRCMQKQVEGQAEAARGNYLYFI